MAEKADPKGSTYMLGRYRVIEPIGRGGMASVLLARLDGFGGFRKWVAIKVIHPELLNDRDSVEMFFDEARTAARITHNNVVQVFDLGEENGSYWLAMEYLHGQPLRSILEETLAQQLNPISPLLALKIISEAAEGLHAAHELTDEEGTFLNVVHRDVSPHNIFVSYDGQVKVMDFGVAKVADRLVATRKGTIKGKLAYMSPEQAMGGDVDRRTDVFALGVVLWELLTNKRLFRASTDMDTLDRVRRVEAPKVSQIISDCPLGLDAILQKALAKDRDKRFATARDLSIALQECLFEAQTFVSIESVSDYMHELFVERIIERQQKLIAAAELTNTLSVMGAKEKDKTSTPMVGADELTASLGNTRSLGNTQSVGSTQSEEATDPQSIVKPDSAPLHDTTKTGPTVVERPVGKSDSVRLQSNPSVESSFRPIHLGLAVLFSAVCSSLFTWYLLAPMPGVGGRSDHAIRNASVAIAQGDTQKGFLTVECKPQCAKITIDGITAQQPIEKMSVPIGNHEIVGHFHDQGIREFSVNVEATRVANVKLLRD